MSEKVSLILSYVKHNGLNGCTPPRFSLRSWEQLSKMLVTFFPGVPLYGTHIHLKNALWSFVLLESARSLFRLRSGPCGKVVGLGRLPFGWKYSPYICQKALARLVEAVPPPPRILLVHTTWMIYYWCTTIGSTCASIRGAGGEGRSAEGGFIVSPKSILDPSTRLVFLAKRTDLLNRVGHMRSPIGRCLWHGFS